MQLKLARRQGIEILRLGLVRRAIVIWSPLCLPRHVNINIYYLYEPTRIYKPKATACTYGCLNSSKFVAPCFQSRLDVEALGGIKKVILPQSASILAERSWLLLQVARLFQRVIHCADSVPSIVDTYVQWHFVRCRS